MDKVIRIKFAKIYSAWKTLEEHGRKELETELRELHLSFQEVLTILTHHTEPKYFDMYVQQYVNIQDKIPNLISFFEVIKKESEDWYKNISDNVDIINIDDYLKFKEMSIPSRLEAVLHSLSYSSYISHALLKIYDEKCIDKKMSMLKGLLAI